MNIQRYLEIESEYANELNIQPIDYEIFIDSLNAWIRVQVVGNGKPILFIHGAPASGTIFYPLLPGLKENSCILIDRLGCGLSDTINNELLSKEELADITNAIIEAVCGFFKLDKIDLIASSFGGYLTLLVLLKQSSMINKVVLLGCPALVECMQVPFFMKVITTNPIKWLLPKLTTTKSVQKNILRQLGHSKSIKSKVVSLSFINWYRGLFNNTETQKNELKVLGKVLKLGRMNDAFMLRLEELKKIEYPILLLWGEDDPFGGVFVADQLHHSLKNSSLMLFKNSGHLSWVDVPIDHAIQINSFLK